MDLRTIIAISAFRLDSDQKAGERTSGTGGFAFWGESALPVVHDLNSQEGLDFFGLEASELPETHFVPFRVRPGEDASCLNLNRAQRPRLLGLSPDLLTFRGAFSFAKTLPQTPSA